MSAAIPAPAAAADADEGPSLRGAVAAALITIAAFGGGFLGWTFFARLDSAVIAPGIVVADSHRKVVQHLEGGILRELLVREGQLVAAGQTVALLDATQADSQLGQLLGQIDATKSRIARLLAEQRVVRKLALPPELVARATGDPILAETLATQTRLFDARWRATDSTVGVLRQRIAQFREEIVAGEAQLTAASRRLSLLEEELVGAEQLLSKGFERRPRILELQRAAAEMKGRQGELRGGIARARQAIAGAEIEIAGVADARAAEVGKELQDARVLEADLADRIRAARDVRQRREVVSPQAGIVVDIRTVTMGGVIGAGQPLMDIVPVDDELIVEGRVAPGDIDSVREGLPTQVRLTAYKRTIAPLIDGRLTYVSADMLTDPKTQDRYFLVRIRLDKDSLDSQGNIRLTTGMLAEVMIVTGERRAIDYLVAPFAERLRRGMREE